MRLVDFLIREQQLILSVLSLLILIALVVLATYRSKGEATESGVRGEGVQFRLAVLVRRAFGSRTGRVAVVLAGVLSVLALIAPIPKSAGLDLGEVENVQATSSGRLIMLIHGWRGDSMKTWRQFPELLRTDPSLSGYRLLVVDYPTFLVRRNLRVTEMARWLLESIRKDNPNEQYEEVVIIAHSMGGVLAREIVVQSRLRGELIPVRTIVSIASPFEGTDRAKLASALGISKNLTRDLVPDSGFLVGLRQHWNELRPRPYTYCITSPRDRTVKQESATSQCDESFKYPQWNHREMVKPSQRSDPRYSTPVRAIRVARGGSSGEPSDGSGG